MPLYIDSIKRTWVKSRAKIDSRLKEFRDVWLKGAEKDIFPELVFCLFTPQSKAKSCWEAVRTLDKKKLLYGGTSSKISSKINKVRFRNNKAKYLVLARDQFTKNNRIFLKKMVSEFKNTIEAREWLVRNVKGLGYKEASHFLRNIGLGENIAILDRHILKNLKLAGVIKKIPKTITKKNYFELEKKMAEFAKKSGIPLGHLDLLFWSKETGEIFK